MNYPIKLSYGDMNFSIKSRHNHWYLDFYFNKKRIRKTTQLKDTSENLIHIKKVIIPELIVGLTGKKAIEYDKKELTLEQFANDFFKVYENTVREHVYKTRFRHYEIKIRPYFKEFELKDITPIMLESWQNKLLDKYSTQSVVKYRSVFYSIFDKALINDLIKFNPLSRIKSPLTINKKFKTLEENENDDISPFNDYEIKQILINTDGSLYYTVYFMLYTGIRPGELISLTWNDIDYKRKRIAIDKTTVNGKVGNVKTQSSVRYIDILPQLEIKLKELQRITGNYTHLLISSFNKPFYSHAILSVRFRKLLKEINIKERTLYNLRHTFASHMISNIQNGIDILWVSRMLGHKDVSITLKSYAKYIKEEDEERLIKIDKIGTILVTF